MNNQRIARLEEALAEISEIAKEQYLSDKTYEGMLFALGQILGICSRKELKE